MHSTGKKPCHVQVSVIGTVSFLNAIKKLKPQLSAGKIMASVFSESEGVIRVDFLSHGVTVNA
jgi:hypothetical protein